MIRDPGLEQLASPVTRRALTAWQDCRNGKKLPARTDIDPTGKWKPILPYMILLRIDRDRDDFYYSLVGTEVSSWAKEDFTGRWLSEIDLLQPATKLRALFHATINSACPVLGNTPYEGRSAVVQSVEDICLPLSADGVVIDQLIAVVDYHTCL